MMAELKNDVLRSGILDFPVYPIQETTLGLEGEVEKRKAIVLVCYADKEVEEPFLHKILGAVKLDPRKDVLLLPLTADNKTCFPWLSTSSKADKVLIFGFTAKELGMNLAYVPYQVQSIAGYQILMADPLKDIGADPTKKRQLWSALQVMFPENA